MPPLAQNFGRKLLCLRTVDVQHVLQFRSEHHDQLLRGLVTELGLPHGPLPASFTVVHRAGGVAPIFNPIDNWCMIDRDLAKEVTRAASWYPVVTLTGPRQSGKTTLVRHLFADRPYITLEPLDIRSQVQEDPRGFLADHAGGAVIDEVQHVPELLPYLQQEVDERPQPGRFVLTGSQHLGLMQAVTQSLAGRTAILHLHPLSWVELRRFADAPTELWDVVWAGGFPRIHDVGIPPNRWLADYTATYVERDVRQILSVGDLRNFRTFLELLAGRTAQEENLTALGSDTGVARNTAAAWLSVLETTFMCFRLPAWSANVRKRAVKAAKLHLADTGRKELAS